MLSSGVRNLGKLIGGWTLAFGLAAVAIANFDEIRTHLGLTFTAKDFGHSARAPVPEPEVRTIIRYVERQPDERDAPRRVLAQRSATEVDLFQRAVALPRGSDGHFRANAEINGRHVETLVDTGATLVAMSYEDAAAIGISVGSADYRYVSNTANGQARFARVTLDEVRIGSVVVRNVPAAVSEPGKLGTTLLGMSFLGQLRVEMKGGRLVLEQ